MTKNKYGIGPPPPTTFHFLIKEELLSEWENVCVCLAEI